MMVGLLSSRSLVISLGTTEDRFQKSAHLIDTDGVLGVLVQLNIKVLCGLPRFTVSLLCIFLWNGLKE